MDEYCFQELIKSARKIACSPSVSPDLWDKAQAFLGRLLEAYGHGEESKEDNPADGDESQNP